MLPILAEHVVVFEALAVRQNIGERRLVRRPRTDLGVAVGQTPDLIADAKLERVAVLPADGDLQDEVQIVEADIGRHVEAAANARRHVVDLDGKPRDFACSRRRSRHSAACWKVSISSRG